MSLVDIAYLAEKLARSLGTVKQVCLSASGCTTVYNPRLELVWDSNGYLVEIRLIGSDEDGRLRRFKRTLTWSSEGYLIAVSEWREVTS